MTRETRIVLVLLLAASAAGAADKEALIADALSAGPPAITEKAAVKDADGNVLRAGSNGWTCYPGSQAIGPMCNQPQWDALIGALVKQEPIQVKEFSISYMLAGDANASGVSNSDPFAKDPHAHGDYIKEGPHLMIAVPDAKLLEGLSTDPADPVYVMWKGTPYAHLMVKTAPLK